MVLVVIIALELAEHVPSKEKSVFRKLFFLRLTVQAIILNSNSFQINLRSFKPQIAMSKPTKFFFFLSLIHYSRQT